MQQSFIELAHNLLVWSKYQFVNIQLELPVPKRLHAEGACKHILFSGDAFNDRWRIFYANKFLFDTYLNVSPHNGSCTASQIKTEVYERDAEIKHPDKPYYSTNEVIAYVRGMRAELTAAALIKIDDFEKRLRICRGSMPDDLQPADLTDLIYMRPVMNRTHSDIKYTT